MSKTTVYYWAEDKFFGAIGPHRLWSCWVFPDNDDIFVQWMKDNMNGLYNCTHRFNGGHPMYTVDIYSEEDATLFKLKWV